MNNPIVIALCDAGYEMVGYGNFVRDGILYEITLDYYANRTLNQWNNGKLIIQPRNFTVSWEKE